MHLELMRQSIPAVPIPPPGIGGAFSHTFHPGSRALAFYPITPGHLTISLFSPYNIVAFLMTNSSANTVSFVLNASRLDIKWDARAVEWPSFALTTGNKTQLGLNFVWISLDFTESKTRNEENKTFLTCLSHHPGEFEQLFCPGGGAFASLFSKNPNSRGSAGGGGGGVMGTVGID